MQKLYLLRPTPSDVRDQRIRFLTSPGNSKLVTLVTPIEVEDDLYHALPRATSGNIALPSLSPILKGEYPPLAEIERMLTAFTATARRCECGKLREYTLQRCHVCTRLLIAARKAEREGLSYEGGDYRGRYRTDEMRENTRETKYGVDR